MWLIPKRWKWGMILWLQTCSPCSLWCCTLPPASSISSCPLNSDPSLPTARRTVQLWGSQAAPAHSEQTHPDEENHSLPQAEGWCHGYTGILLYWSACLNTQALDFILCDTHRAVLDCDRHHRLHWALLPPEPAKQGISISSFPQCSSTSWLQDGNCHFDDFTDDVERQFPKRSLICLYTFSFTASKSSSAAESIPRALSILSLQPVMPLALQP